MLDETIGRSLATVATRVGLALAALTATALPALAASPAAGTLSETSREVTWTGGPLASTRSADCGGPDNPACDNFRLTIEPPSFPFEVEITLTPFGADDWDLQVYAPDGGVTDSGEPPGLPEQVLLINPAGGVWTASAAPYLVTSAYSARARLLESDTPPPPPPPTSGERPPTYALHVSPPGSADSAAEPTLGVNFATNQTMFITWPDTYRIGFDSCSPARDTWTDVSFLTTSLNTNDPILFTDQELGRTFVSHLQFPTKQSLWAQTDDDGESWTPGQGSGINCGVDHQGVGGGPFSDEGPLGPITDYPNAVYYCAQDIALAQCAVSLDGGLTFLPGVPIYNALECGGLHGHPKVGPDGTVFVPNKSCGGLQAVVVSTDNGLTWDVREVPGITAGEWDPSVAIGPGGTVYLGAGAGNGHPMVAVSRDGGLTWSEPQDVGVAFGIKNTAFAAMIAGDDDRAAFAFLGTSTAGNGAGDDPSWPAEWHVYVAHTYDGGQTWVTVNATPGDPVQRGTICGGGFNGCPNGTRNLLDFMDVTIDREGRVLVAYADGCMGSCVAGPPNSFTEKGAIARQVNGKRLFAAFDVPAAPDAPPAEAKALAGGAVRVSWAEPDDHGSPVTAYHVRRRTASTGTVALATVAPDARSFEDAAPPQGETLFYSVVAENAHGQSAVCNEASPGEVEPEPDPCTLPGVEVATDPQGDVALPGGAANDLLAVHVAEPATAGEARLVFTTTVDDLSSLPPNSIWRTSFVAPNPVACGPLGTPSSTYFVDLNTNNLTPACRYGCLDGNIFRSQGTADGCEVNAAEGTLRVTVLNSRVGNPQPGQAIAAVTGRAEILVGAGGTGALQVVDQTSPGSYTLSGNGSCAAGAPNANDDAASTQEGRPVVIAVLANDSDPDGDAIAIQSVGAAASGATSDNGDGTVTYAPGAGFSGTDRFTYTIADATGLTDTAEVTVTVNPKCPPTPTGGFADDMETGGQPGWETATGVNTLGPLSPTWAIVEDAAAHSPTHSWFSDATTVEVKDDYLVSPPLDLSGTSRLVFWHRHGFEAGDPGQGYDGGVLEVSTDGGGSWVDVTERGAFLEGGYDATIAPNFGSPIAGRSAWSGSRAEPGRVVVDLGGFAGDDVRVRWRLATDQVAIGAVPGEGWWVDDVLFTDLLEPAATCNEPPVASADEATTDFETAVTVDVLANDSDPDGDELALDGVTAAANGAAVANGDGTVTYTPNAGFSGTDGFTYTVSDGNGGTATAPVTITVREAGNRAPVVADDAASTAENKPVAVDVLANDSDPDGDVLEIVALGVAPNGRVVAKKSGVVSYKPNQGFVGTDQFTYTVSDGHGHTATATVRVTVSSR